MSNSRVEFKERAVIIDGRKTQIIAGAMHYFRVPREYWRDRMEKAVQLGLNCIETYMCWNLHERKEGVYDFSGMLDFEKFIRTAHELGLYVIVRPGPYICSEWDNGGIPSWLMNKSGIRYRRMNKPYIDALTTYLNVIIPKLKALQYDDGGPIIAMQIENEYGSYSCDKTYLAYLRDLYRNAGITIPLFTADGIEFGNPNKLLMINGGTIDGAAMCLNFGSRGIEGFDLGKTVRPDDPPFCTEFWCGWFDAWGCGTHHTRSPQNAAEELDDMLAYGGNVDFYMFHGGTNFAFTAGANGTNNKDYAPDVTSYDFDAILSEAGDPTEKFFAIQNVIRKYAPDRKFGTPVPVRKLPSQRLNITAIAPLHDNLDNIAQKVSDPSPLTFEELGQDFGYVFYRTFVPGPKRGSFKLQQVRDRANVYFNGELFHTYYRNDDESYTPTREFGSEGATLELLVENLGRINYAHLVGRDNKGICGDVAFAWQILVDWEMWALPSDSAPDEQLDWKPFQTLLRGKPAYYLVEFDVEDPADAFLKFPGIHGGVWLNGHAIGRYWDIGPGSTLYLPGAWMKKGKNRLIIFETDKLIKPYIDILDHPELNEKIKV